MTGQEVYRTVRAPLSIAAVIIAAALAIGGTPVGVVACVLVYLIVLSVMLRIPVRYSMMGLTFLAFALENPGDTPAQGVYSSPIFPVGAVLLTHLNTVDRSVGAFSWMMFSGMDICLVTLLLIAWFRTMSGSAVDGRNRVPGPRPLVRLAYVSLGGMLLIWFHGLLRGGDFGLSLWQLDRVMYLPTIFLLYNYALRGPEDLGAMARVLVAAGIFKAVWAFIVINTVFLYPNWETGGIRLSYATTHHDSMLFAIAFLLPLAMMMERVGWSSVKLAAIVVPIIAIGIFSNNRRMAWVQIGVVILSTYLVTPDNRFKRKLRRLSVRTLPITLLYLLVGWNNKSFFLFKPIASLRSVVDSESNASSFWRDIENFNLIQTVKLNPFLGSGYGHPYLEVIPIPPVGYSLEYVAPHNAILGLWAFAGPFGYAALTLLWVAGIFFAMRAYHAAKEPAVRAGAIVCFAAVPIYLIQCWGDLGLGTWIGVFITGPAIAMAGKLAVASGAWGAKKGPAEVKVEPPLTPLPQERAA
jgi:hypothetical protein